jgi:hypothetical protein
MLKYIKNSTNPRTDILELLVFSELRQKGRYQLEQYSNFLKINEVIKKITFLPENRRRYRRIK